uniref:Putative activating signal cointegrator 1 complex subunit 2 protein isoform x2 n=1 Tax=Panstrongylus megistus TaxID=65343 RepID=A0A069DS27_9HEMI
MAFRSNLVNKQFNSPIKLYSPENVADALEKQKQILANGAVGIDFHNLAKPGNLANSAVLRMLEEEQSNRSRSTGVKRVAWPPPPEDNLEEEAQIQYQQQPGYPQGLQSVQKPASPVKSVKPPSPSPQLVGFGGRRPEEPPILAHTYTSPTAVPHSPPIAHTVQTPYYPVHFEPPKTTVTLLPTAPVRQKPSPVYISQPVTATVKGGARMRGDQKWPPESVKQQAAAENEARVALAKGPACRPRKVRKDYTTFFAQHALTTTYPGYKAPPGTQHYMEGASNL